MKTSLTKLKSSLILSLTIVSSFALAKPVAQVVEVNGQVFAVTFDGQTKTLNPNDHIEEKSEIMVGEGSSITLNDYYDATYHMVEGSHLKFFNKSVQLKKGKTWIQSLNARHPLVLTTANGHVNFWKGEFITTFDRNTSKTQVLVVNGDVEVSNVLDKNMKYTVSAGTFSTIDPETENGHPRSPTKVGLSSLYDALAEFKSIPEKMRNDTPSRSIASVTETTAPAAKKGHIIFMSNGAVKKRAPASVKGGAHSYFKHKVGHKSPPATVAPIHFYGMTQKVATDVAPRLPASVKSTNMIILPKKIGSELNVDSDFSESLRIEKASQPKHSKELESLIQDLKSY
jgi:hypothetical protein